MRVTEDRRRAAKNSCRFATIIDGRTIPSFIYRGQKSPSSHHFPRPFSDALFTNEQLADIAKARCRSVTDLGKIDGVGAGRMEKYGAAVLTLLRAELPAEPGAAQPPAESSGGRP